MREIWPVKGSDGRWWANWEITNGTMLFRCNKHRWEGHKWTRRLSRDVVLEYIRRMEAGDTMADLEMKWV